MKAREKRARAEVVNQPFKKIFYKSLPGMWRRSKGKQGAIEHDVF